MARSQSAALDRKKLMADPIMVTTIVVLITFLTLFILYPLAILLVDSFVGDGSFGFGIFERIFAMPTFTKATTCTLNNQTGSSTSHTLGNIGNRQISYFFSLNRRNRCDHRSFGCRTISDNNDFIKNFRIFLQNYRDISFTFK